MGKAVQRLPSTTDELREAIREANEALRDIKTERKALEEARTQLRADMEEARRDIRVRVKQWLEEATSDGAKALSDDLEAVRAQIFKRFDKITSILLGAKGQPALERLVGNFVSTLTADEREKLAGQARQVLSADDAPASLALLEHVRRGQVPKD